MNQIGKDPEELFNNEPKDRLENIRDLLKEKKQIEKKIRAGQQKLREERNIEPESKKHPIKRLKSAAEAIFKGVKSAIKMGWKIARE